MEKKVYDVIVIGSGSGLEISSEAASKGMKVAVIEKGAFGGTCLNRGCIPSKMLIHVADIAETIKKADSFGIKSKFQGTDWNKIQKRVWNLIDKDSKEIEKGNKEIKNIDVYNGTAKFIDKKTLEINNKIISAEKIFICAGARPIIPKIEGIDKANYYTSENIMRLKKQPRSMIILGGGYISAELGHFFSALGTNVTIINRSELMLSREDEDISRKFTEVFSKKCNLMLNTNTLKIEKSINGIAVEVEQNKKKKKIKAEVLLVTTGITPNSDILDVKKTQVETNESGYIKVDDYLETNVKGIWAIGDIVGKYLFKHNANLEAGYCINNAFEKKKLKVDYNAMPHAIFSSPQIGSVGLTEQELKEKSIKYGVGKYNYYDTAMGTAIQDKEGFVKLLADKERNILGCHILGTNASVLIHEVIVAMKAGIGIKGITRAVHIHPALNEVVQRAFFNVKIP